MKWYQIKERRLARLRTKVEKLEEVLAFGDKLAREELAREEFVDRLQAIDLAGIEASQAKFYGKTWCGTCGWRYFEDHPRRPGIKRCDNCKEYRVRLSDE